MPKRLDYTTRARAFALRFPTLNHIAIQVNFWVIAFILLAIIIHITSLSLVKTYSLPVPVSLGVAVLMSLITGLIYGTILGFIDIITERGFIQRWSLGLIILLKSVIYFMVLIGMISFIRYVLWELG